MAFGTGAEDAFVVAIDPFVGGVVAVGPGASAADADHSRTALGAVDSAGEQIGLGEGFTASLGGALPGYLLYALECAVRDDRGVVTDDLHTAARVGA